MFFALIDLDWRTFSDGHVGPAIVHIPVQQLAQTCICVVEVCIRSVELAGHPLRAQAVLAEARHSLLLSAKDLWRQYVMHLHYRADRAGGRHRASADFLSRTLRVLQCDDAMRLLAGEAGRHRYFACALRKAIDLQVQLEDAIGERLEGSALLPGLFGSRDWHSDLVLAADDLIFASLH